LSYLSVTDFGGEQRLVGRLTAGAEEQSNAWGSIAGLLGMGSYSTRQRRRTSYSDEAPALCAKILTGKDAKESAKYAKKSISYLRFDRARGSQHSSTVQ
jgi:hypothetical protein